MYQGRRSFSISEPSDLGIRGRRINGLQHQLITYFSQFLHHSCYHSYKLGPEDVIKFCTDCVLSDEEGGECELPEKFYDGPTP